MNTQLCRVAFSTHIALSSLTTFAVTLTQITDQLTLQFAAWVGIDGEVNSFVTHMSLGLAGPDTA
ncbi:hypothetical protein D3C81_2149520 [compost metagenome]